jgi:hypothetical protein
MLFSAVSVLGSRAGSVASPVSGCPGCAWVWRPVYRPRGSIRSGCSLALALPAGVSPSVVAEALLAVFPGVRVRARRHRGRWFLRVRGSRLFAVACWFASR